MDCVKCEKHTNQSSVVSSEKDKIKTMTTNSNNNHNIEKLRGRENYEIWSRQAKSYLIIKGLWEFVDAEQVNTDKAAEDAKALAEITLLIEPYNFGHIANADTANKAWKCLEGAFQSNGLSRKVELLKSLAKMQMNDFDNMKEYINSFTMTSFQCTRAGFNLDDELLASLLLAGLPSECDSLVLALENQQKKLTLDSVKNTLLQDKKFDKDSDNGSALFTKGGKDKTFKCHICGKPGHFAKSCFWKNKKKQSKMDNKKSNNVLFASFLTSSANSNEWYVDSGATQHMTKSEHFVHGKQKSEHDQITVANNNKLTVACVGDIPMTLTNGKSKIDSTLKNVKCVPDLCTNLLSVSQMAKKGHSIIFKSDYCHIFDKNRKLIASASMVNDLYRLNGQAKENNSTNSESEPYKALIAKTSSAIWHRRMGHICQSNLKKVKNSTIGMECNEIKDKINCKVCAIGKQSRAPFKHTGTHAKAILELVHSDICGPMPVKSFGGNKYFVTFIDDFSRNVTVVPIKEKSQALSEFIKFKTICENQFSKKVMKIIRTDNGKEYVNHDFDQYLLKHGIIHQKSAPYVHEQLGVAERMNRTLMERVRCMLYDTNMKHIFWAEAVTTAAYLINRTPCRDQKNTTPHEIWTGMKPNLSHIRIFGSTAMVHVPKEKRNKLESKSIECVLLGYCSESKAYRLFNASTRKIIVSRDVIFHESENEVNNSFNENKSIFTPIEVDEPNSNSSDDKFDDSGSEASSITLVESPIQSSSQQSNATDENVVEDPIAIPVTVEVPATNDSNQSIDGNDRSSYQVNDSDDISYSTTDDESSSEGDSSGRMVNTRQSARIANLPKPNYRQPDYSFQAFDDPSSDPLTSEEALARPDGHLWKKAMEEEIEAHAVNGTWILTDLPSGKKPIPNKWVFKMKRDANGSIIKYKARLVVKGCSQKYGIDFNETFAPVVRYNSLRYLIALAAKYDLHIHQMDAVTAFLNGELKEEIYMSQPTRFDDGTTRVCKLKKSMYGLKQASRDWNRELNSVLVNYGLNRNKADQCVYHLIEGKRIIIVAIWVDDVVIFSNDMDLVSRLKNELSRNFKMKDLGEASQVLGMRIARDRKAGIITIDQKKYIQDVLNRFGMKDCNPASTPLDPNQKISAKFCPTTEAEKYEMLNVPYMSLVGSLLFAAQVSRPDINFAVNLLSRYGTNPGKVHWGAAKRVLRYLQGTINKCLVYTNEPSELEGYCDADYASDLDQRKSTTAYIFKLQGAAITWNTKRQKTIALSSTESEFMSMVAATKEAIWLKRLEEGIFSIKPNTLTLHCDNRSAMITATNNSYSDLTKHVHVKGSFISQKIDEGIIQLKHLPTDKMLADFLTKGVGTAKHNYSCENIGLKDFN